MRTFEFTDDKSNKFWNVELKGKTVTTYHGKIGAAGRETPKDFPDAAAAKKEHDKLVAEKLKKGYKETTKGGAPAAAAPAPAPAPAAAAEPAKPKAGKSKKAEAAPAAAPAPAAAAPAAAPAGKRTFEFTDDKSNKFWSIARTGKTVTTYHGKIGTAGRETPKDFPDEAAAKKEYDKLVAEKVKKGYQEKT